jgi:hypothetical protein
MPYSSFCAPRVPLPRNNVNAYFTLWAPHLGQLSALAIARREAPAGCVGRARSMVAFWGQAAVAAGVVGS